MHQLSPWIMFLNATLFVKAVMGILAFASLVAWTVFIAKMTEVGRSRRRLADALQRIDGAGSLAEARAELSAESNVLSRLLQAAARECSLSAGARRDSGLQERAASRFSEIAREESAATRRGTGALATIGATAPFVGLLGTVWGIMNSFIGISEAQTTNLAVVAPGIAEALLATAIGLVAAIPAVVFYNSVARASKAYLELVQRAAGAAGRLLSRDLDRIDAPIAMEKA